MDRDREIDFVTELMERLTLMSETELQHLPAEIFENIVQHLSVRDYERLASLSPVIYDKLAAVEGPYYRSRLEKDFNIKSLPLTFDARTDYYATLQGPTRLRVAIWFQEDGTHYTGAGYSLQRIVPDIGPPDDIVTVANVPYPLVRAVAKAFFRKNPPMRTLTNTQGVEYQSLKGCLRIIKMTSEEQEKWPGLPHVSEDFRFLYRLHFETEKKIMVQIEEPGREWSNIGMFQRSDFESD